MKRIINDMELLNQQKIKKTIKYVTDEKDPIEMVNLMKTKLLHPGADLGFSRGGGADFQKKFENFDDPFFLGRPN